MNLPLGTLELALAILCAEFALVALAVPAVMLRRDRHRLAGETASAANAAEVAQEMMGDVEQAEPARREALATIFASTYNLDEDAVAGRVDEFIGREQAFYQVMTSVYLERDSERLKEIPAELTKVISPWIRMTPSNMVAAAEVDALAESNSALGAELEETRRSMDELMAEYMKAFQKNTAARDSTAAATGVATEDGDDGSGAAVLDDANTAAPAPDDNPDDDELAAETGEPTTQVVDEPDGAAAVAAQDAESASDGAGTAQDDAGAALADLTVDIDAFIDDSAGATADDGASDLDGIADALLGDDVQAHGEAAADQTTDVVGEAPARDTAADTDSGTDTAADNDVADEVFIDVSADEDDPDGDRLSAGTSHAMSRQDAVEGERDEAVA
ncbi:MAG: hypothetical protein WD928_11015 [Gammaproteobacteria bacterium]